MPLQGTPEPMPMKPAGPIKAVLVYDNILSTDSHIQPSTFVFTPPPGAQRYLPAGTGLAPFSPLISRVTLLSPAVSPGNASVTSRPFPRKSATPCSVMMT